MTRARTVDADVTVVGAGLAGLAAARAVAASGLSVVVLEARDRVGGRTSNHDLGGGRVVDAGGQWIGSTQSRIYQLAAELGVDTFPGKPAEGKHVYIFDGRKRVFGGSLPPSPRLMFDFLQTMLGLRRLEKKVPPDAPWDAPDAASLDSISLKEWIDGRTRTRAGRELLSLFGGIQRGTDPGEVSLLYGDQQRHAWAPYLAVPNAATRDVNQTFAFRVHPVHACHAFLTLCLGRLDLLCAVASDTLHNLGDAFNVIPLWIAFSVGRRRPTGSFTYGYHRAEDVAGVIIVPRHRCFGRARDAHEPTTSNAAANQFSDPAV